MPVLHLEDAEIHYESFGSGPALMFLSATAWHGGVWKLHQVPAFSQDHQVIIYDQRGCGASKANGLDFSTERLARDAVAILDDLNISRASLCGHSNGGRVAQMIAIEHPQRVDKLILASAGGTHSSKGIPIGMCVELAQKGYVRYMREHSIETGFTKDFVERRPAETEAFLRELLDNLTPLEIFLRHVIGRQGSDTTSRIGEIRAKTLVMIGDDEDHGSSSGSTHMDFAKILAQKIPRARLEILSGQGHFYPFVNPRETNALIRDFLMED